MARPDAHGRARCLGDAVSLSPESLALRRTLITATDASAICGVNPWRTAHDVYVDKVCDDGEPRRETFRMRKGNYLEQLGIEWLREEVSPFGVQACGDTTRVHPILTWLGATPDAIVLDVDAHYAVGEIKTAGLGTAADWDDEDGDPIVPDYYAVQVAVQMGVVGVSRAYVVAMLDTEPEPRLYEVAHDEDLWLAIVEQCQRFREDHVLARVAPDVDGSEASRRMLRALFKRERTSDLIAAGPDAEALARAYFEAKRVADEADARKKEAEAKLCALIGEAKGVRGDGWRAAWSYVDPQEVAAYTRAGYRRFDMRAIKAKEKRP